jgi:uncharacterized protein
MNVDDERLEAQSNFDRLVRDIPCRLSDKEEKLPDRLGRSKLKPIKKLETLYSFMNDLYEFSSTYTPCKKGCSDCCYYPITVSEVEIAFIEKTTKKKRNKAFLPAADYHGSPCPFLEQGSCSIYKSRPFVCRRHVVLTKTNTWCAPEVSNDETFPLLSFSGVNDAFDSIRKESGSLKVFDIRQVFGNR